MDNQDLLNKTVEKAVSFLVQGLTPPELDEKGGLELNSEPTVLDLRSFIDYPTAKKRENFIKKLSVFIILKLQENDSLIIQTKEFSTGEFANLVLSSGIDPCLFPQSTTMKISLGIIEITDVIGQGKTIEIK